MTQRSTSPPARTGRDLRAVRDTLPVALSIAPFALVIGATATQLGLPPVADMAAAAVVFAGAAHFAPLTMFAAGAGVFAALGTAVLINARLLLYSASLEPRFRDQPHLLVLARDALDDPSRFRRYWLATGALLLASWTTLVGLGGVLGPLLPAGSPLDAAAVVVLAGMLGPRLAAVRPALVALSALLVAAAGAPLPGGVGLVAGIVAGIMAGALLNRVPR